MTLKLQKKNRAFKDLDVGHCSDKNIYVNDHQTLENKILTIKTKVLAKEHGVEFMWKECKIFINKNLFFIQIPDQYGTGLKKNYFKNIYIKFRHALLFHRPSKIENHRCIFFVSHSNITGLLYS